LPADEAALIAQHLADCPGCQALQDDADRIGRLLRSDPLNDVPAGVWPRIASTAHRGGPMPHRRSVIWVARVATVAAGFAFYLFGFRAGAGPATPAGPIHDAETAHLERVLRDTGIVLAQAGQSFQPTDLLNAELPEARLLREMLGEVMP
jgi:hypothetical protein